MEEGRMNSNDWLTRSMEALLARKQPAPDVAFSQEVVIESVRGHRPSPSVVSLVFPFLPGSSLGP